MISVVFLLLILIEVCRSNLTALDRREDKALQIILHRYFFPKI